MLCIQDGTDLNYNGLAQCEGLGSLGTNQTGASSAGLHLHSTLAVSTEGLPLGVLDAYCQAPPQRSENERASAKAPIEEKKAFDWIQALRECEHAAAQMPGTRVVSVMDRETDFFELFDERRTRGCFMAAAPCTGAASILVDRVRVHYNACAFARSLEVVA